MPLGVMHLERWALSAYGRHPFDAIDVIEHGDGAFSERECSRFRPARAARRGDAPTYTIGRPSLRAAASRRPS